MEPVSTDVKKMNTGVSIVPIFTIQEGKVDEWKAIADRCVEKVKETAESEKCFFYNFAYSGNQACCREMYEDAEGVLAHLGNVGPMIDEFLRISSLELSLMGPAEELEKLKEATAGLNPKMFVLEGGIHC